MRCEEQGGEHGNNSAAEVARKEEAECTKRSDRRCYVQRDIGDVEGTHTTTASCLIDAEAEHYQRPPAVVRPAPASRCGEKVIPPKVVTQHLSERHDIAVNVGVAYDGHLQEY